MGTSFKFKLKKLFAIFNLMQSVNFPTDFNKYRVNFLRVIILNGKNTTNIFKYIKKKTPISDKY